MSQRNCSAAGVPASSLSWADKYQPAAAHEVCGNAAPVAELRQQLEAWRTALLADPLTAAQDKVRWWLAVCRGMLAGRAALVMVVVEVLLLLLLLLRVCSASESLADHLIPS
jgi:hypothetical protein